MSHAIAIYATNTSAYPVEPIDQYAAEVTTPQQVGHLFNGGYPLTYQYFTSYWSTQNITNNSML